MPNKQTDDKFNWKNILSSIHTSGVFSTIKELIICVILTSLTCAGVVLAFKASFFTGVLTLASGPVFLATVVAIGQYYGYNFWNKFMAFVPAFAYLALGAILLGTVPFATTVFTNTIVGSSFIGLWLILYEVSVAILYYFLVKFVQDSLYNTFFIVFFTLSPAGFIFGLMHWGLGLNLASYLVKLF